MANTIVALYDDFGSANAAVKELVDNGFSREDISLVASDATGEYGRYLETSDVDTNATAEGASVGAGIGAVIGGLGGLLVGLGALVIPGIGPVVAAGPLAAALSTLAGAGAGAVAGGVTGGLLGALMDIGVPRESAEYYAEGIRRGGHLVTVNASEAMTNQAVQILNRHNPVDINERVASWRQSGWTGYEPGEQPAATTATTNTMAPGTTTGSVMETTPTYNDFSYYDTDFRRHFETSSYMGDYTYDQFRPAYRYGYDLATDERFRDMDWYDVETEARRRWEERNPGTWDRFKDSVRHAWEEIKDTVS